MTRFVITTFFGLSAAASALANAPSLSQLQPGERLHVSYHSRGCFHDRKYEIDFERAKAVTAHSAGRTILLSRKEIAGLDKLFQFYSSGPRGGCTTQDNISISQFRGSEKISAKHYVDGSCATHQMKDVTEFYDIAKKLGLEHDT
jgi:hypothetical protein